MHYTGTIWRPPYEASSLLLEVTAGCTHHKCKFCTLYSELPFSFRMSPLEDVEQDLKEAKTQYGLWGDVSVSRVFLTGANPFVCKAERLLEITEMIRRYFPECRTIGCFARITDITLKTDGELSRLHEAGYDGLTIGVETGDDAALRFMNKGYASQDIIDQCGRLDASQIGYRFFYLTGISGAGRGEAGARATAEVCNRLHPELIGANMLTVYRESELYREIRNGTWREEGEIEKYRELKVLIEELRIPVIFAAMGASNAVQLRGRLPKDKEKLIGAIETIIASGNERELRAYRKRLPHL